jgi:hypothetical protein
MILWLSTKMGVILWTLMKRIQITIKIIILLNHNWVCLPLYKCQRKYIRKLILWKIMKASVCWTMILFLRNKITPILIIWIKRIITKVLLLKTLITVFIKIMDQRILRKAVIKTKRSMNSLSSFKLQHTLIIIIVTTIILILMWVIK